MDEFEFIILSRNDVFDLGWHFGFGAILGGFCGAACVVGALLAWEWGEKKWEQRKAALEGK